MGDEILMAQVEAAENVVVEGLRKKGLLPPEPPHTSTPHPAELGLMVICNPCGSIIKAEWVVREENPKQAILCVEKCACGSPPEEWQPIETAPKDKRKVLIFHAADDDGDCYKIAYWSDLAARPGWFHRGGWLEESEPDGWTPLPDPPVV